MIDFIKGKLVDINDKKIIVENNGIGFSINFPTSNASNLPDINSDIKVYTYMLVKEEEMSLYGFLTIEDKEMFLKLIDCDGVGPKGAMKIIEHLGFERLIDSIVNKDDKTIATVPGIGSKTASKICIELCDKMNKINLSNIKSVVDSSYKKQAKTSDIENEVAKALMKLGYKNKEAHDMISNVPIDISDTTESLLQKVLKKK